MATKAERAEVAPRSADLPQAVMYAMTDSPMIAYWDADLRNVFASTSYRDWCGLSGVNVRGMHVRQMPGPEDQPGAMPHVTAVLTGATQAFAVTSSDAAGEVRHVEAVYLANISDGVVLGFLSFLTASRVREAVPATVGHPYRDTSVLSQREVIAAEVCDLAITCLFNVTLELASALALMDPTAAARLGRSIDDIDAAIVALRSSTIGSAAAV